MKQSSKKYIIFSTKYSDYDVKAISVLFNIICLWESFLVYPILKNFGNPVITRVNPDKWKLY